MNFYKFSIGDVLIRKGTNVMGTCNKVIIEKIHEVITIRYQVAANTSSELIKQEEAVKLIEVPMEELSDEDSL